MFVRRLNITHFLSRSALSAGAAALLIAVLAPAALAGPPCATDCKDDRCRRPVRYTCQLKVESEPIEKECNLIETEAVCIPPITTSPFDCVRDLLTGKKRSRHGCGVDGCTTAGCDGGCGSHGRIPRQTGWLAKLTNHGRGCCGGIRCVNTLDTHEYECGERCVCKWEAVPVGQCGCGPAACGPVPTHDAGSAPKTNGAAPPAPAPMPAPPSVQYDLPTLDATPAERGVAKPALEE